MSTTENIAASVALKVRNIIADHMGSPIDEVTAEKRLYTDFHADSLDKLEMLLSIEDQFGISIDESKDDSIVTVQHLIDAVLEELKS